MSLLPLVLLTLLLSLLATQSAAIAEEKNVEALRDKSPAYGLRTSTGEYSQEGPSDEHDVRVPADARDRTVGENSLAEYITRRLAETERAIGEFADKQKALMDAFALRHKELLRQEIADFALSFARPAVGVTGDARPVTEHKEQATRQMREHAHVDLADVSNTNLGEGAGQTNQRAFATAIGNEAGNSNQGSGAIAVGAFAGQTDQGQTATAIGYAAGDFNQGSNSVAVGAFAGEDAQHSNTIIISASGTVLNSVQTGSFYVKPIRGVNQASVPSSSRELRYDTDSGEIFYLIPTEPTSTPTALPTTSTPIASSRPECEPTSPTKRPSRRPTKRPTKKPVTTNKPTSHPSVKPRTGKPSKQPIKTGWA